MKVIKKVEDIKTKQSINTSLDKPKRKFRLGFVTKIFVAYLTIYIGVCVGYAAFNPAKYEYRDFNWLEYTGTVLMQPTMDIFGDGKVSHWYDWNSIGSEKINQTVEAATIYGKNSPQRDYEKNLTLNNMVATLNKIDEAAIVEPKNHSGEWSLVFCTEDKKICKESNILVTGKVKILVDGNVYLWGLDEKGDTIPVIVKEYIDRSNEEELILI